MYKITQGKDANGSIITQLMLGGTAMVCPFKTMQAIMQQEQINKLAVVGQKQIAMNFKGYIQQPCDNRCPLFEFKENAVTIHCGSTPVTHSIEKK